MISPGNPILFSHLDSSCRFCLQQNLTKKKGEATTKLPNSAYEANDRFSDAVLLGVQKANVCSGPLAILGNPTQDGEGGDLIVDAQFHLFLTSELGGRENT